MPEKCIRQSYAPGTPQSKNFNPSRSGFSMVANNGDFDKYRRIEGLYEEDIERTILQRSIRR